MKINKEISRIFLTDTRDYLNRYKILKENATHLGLRSKLLLELLFALECSIKALIYLESTETEKITYKRILTHNLKNLSDLLNEKSKKEFLKIITTDLSVFDIDIRYQLESEIVFRTVNGCLDEKYYNTIANFTWLDNIYNQITNFISYIETLNPYKLEVINFSNINIEEIIQKHKIITNLREK